MIKVVFAGASVILTGASIAIAQPAPPRTDTPVSVSEMKQRGAERFNAIDSNKDGQLTLEEMKAGRPGPGMRGMEGRRGQFGMGPGGRGGRFGRQGGGPGGPGGPGPLFRGADVNDDGVVTQQEFSARAQEQFKQLDTNSDGRIAADEARPERGAMIGRMGERRFSMLDADKNGSVSRTEFDRPFAERVGRLDANNDGQVTPEERRAARGRPGRP